MLPHGNDRRLSLWRWFVFAGAAGLAVAIILADLLSHDFASPRTLELLWPSSIVGALGKSTVPAQLLAVLVMYGGQFLLYGLIGLVAAAIVDQVRRKQSHR